MANFVPEPRKWMPDLLVARPRLFIAIAIGLAVGLGCLAFPEMSPSTRLILGWDALTFSFLGSASSGRHSGVEMTPGATRSRPSKNSSICSGVRRW